MNENNINRLTAERVMGWKDDPAGGWLRPNTEQQPWVWTGYLSVDPTYTPCDTCSHCQHQTPAAFIGTEKWSPARDMNQAMEAFRKFSADSQAAHPDTTPGCLINIHPTETTCDVFSMLIPHLAARATANKPETAVCLALLRAVGVPDEEVNRE